MAKSIHFHGKDKMNEKEIEAKFYLSNLDGLRRRLEQSGAELAKPRVREINLRFDTPGQALSARGQVLRLRQDSAIRMTYKGPAEAGQSVAVRREIEFQVSDLEAATHLLEALGYEVMVMYEKFRTTYHFGGAEITLDEMPYGSFSEIEAPDAETIHTLADQLGLDWEARINASYLDLFRRLKANRQLQAQHLSFAELEGLSFSPEDLNVRASDKPRA